MSEYTLQKYVKKPIAITAVRFGGELTDAVIDILKNSTDRNIKLNDDGTLSINTLEGVMTANIGDWIVCGVKGECYPVRDDIFKETYRKA